MSSVAEMPQRPDDGRPAAEHWIRAATKGAHTDTWMLRCWCGHETLSTEGPVPHCELLVKADAS